MPNIVQSFISASLTLTENGSSHVVKCDSRLAIFFETHPYFIKPVLKTCIGNRIRAVFRGMDGGVIELNSNILKNLLMMFVFLKENNLAISEVDNKSFCLENDRLFIAKPWCVAEVTEHTKISDMQEKVRPHFHYPNPPDTICDVLTRFFKGESPDHLLHHPAFWGIEKRKCFILDVAGARAQLEENERPPLEFDWVNFMTRHPELSKVLEAQKKFYARKRNGRDPLNGSDLLSLEIFMSNFIRHFEEGKRDKIHEIPTIDQALEIVEKEFDLIYAAWSTLSLEATEDLKSYKLPF